MALSLEDAGKVRQKTNMYTRNPLVFYTLKAFFLWWATNKGNANLQFIPFSAADIVTNTGYSPIGGVTSTVHFLYAKNSGTGDGTNAYIRLYNDTTNTTNTLAYVTGLISDDNDIFMYVNPNGIVFGTDLTISSDTGSDATESAEANAADGFVIVSA